ncbi:Pre-mRNA-splicing factor [Boothiomyces macroporosus]|uniref:Pre-mRNA-splicing factor n=1 Tax=Boothiomyces macroporosus TaxID=261099 RepID=A0AAD5UEN4_9FUNG|nr:Pre-mRNA-splicing factor [Boothiomyces macroporosus]
MLKIVPEAIPEKVAQVGGSEYGVHDTFRNGFRGITNEITNKHPLETRLAMWQETQQELKYEMLRQTQGIHAPIRLKMEKMLVGNVKRIPVGKTHNLGLDILNGTDDTIDFEDFLGDRPARVQTTYKEASEREIPVVGEYNVWYSKYAGEGSLFGKGVEQSKFRLVVERDAGRTRANSRQLFCIHFARGMCIRGPNCNYLHRIPMKGDREDTCTDVFGREKFRHYRDDMGGVGSFEKRCRTLYVGNIGINEHLQEICTNHFSEFGELEYCNVLQMKGVAFVQYKSILNAEFAMEAMRSQTLESSEIINIRWATEDPNPQVNESLKRKAEEDVIETVKAQLPIVGDQGTILDYQQLHKLKKIEYKKEEKVELYGDDLDAWQQYCQQYYEEYGVYPEGVQPQKEQESASQAYSIPKQPESKKLVEYESSDDE